MKYLVYTKNDVCMAKGVCKSVEDAELFMAVYDAVEEVTAEVYKTITIPAVKVNGIWKKADNVPAMEYPETPEQGPSEMEQLRADIDYIAIMTGVEL